MKRAVEQEGGPFTLFGGEPLLVCKEMLRELWSWGFLRWGRNGIQTNGTLIKDHHIQMFKEYKVHVGISIDGPDDLNALRWAGSDKETAATTAATESAIERLCREGIQTSLIATLHRLNATNEKLYRMHKWFRHLDNIGIKSVRLHILEVDRQIVKNRFALDTEGNIRAFLSFAKLEEELPSLRFDVFRDMRSQLLGRDQRSTCIWNACDPYTTRAVKGIEGDGQRSNCGRTNKNGINFVKADREGFERYLALYQTPQKYGGCRRCRFFLMCKGQCPGTGILRDWRNRSEHCDVWRTLYTFFEDQLINRGFSPISDIPSFRIGLEQAFLQNLAAGRYRTIASLLQEAKSSKQQGTKASALSYEVATNSNTSGNQSLGSYHMKRLPFVLPDFLRVAWVSARAKEIWMPRIQRIRAIYHEVEWRSILHGVRHCSLTTIAPENIIEFSHRLSDYGLSVLPLEKEGASHYEYISTKPLVRPGRAYNFCAVSGKVEDVALFKDAWISKDYEKIGILLGYPRCCIKFFRKVWVDQRFVDTIWPMALRTAGHTRNPRKIDVNKTSLANILWRWMGVRLVPHLPCRFDCRSSADFARAMLKIGRTCGFNLEMDWLLEMLSWPVQWSALHGIAEVKTPILKMSTRTDSTSRKYIVQYSGNAYPKIGAKGFGFPYERASFLRKESLAKCQMSALSEHESYYKDNGFASRDAMEMAHQPIIELVLNIVGEGPANVVDFGCGNGALLSKIVAMNERIVPYGIDCDSSRVEHAQQLHPEFRENFILGDIFESALDWDLKGLSTVGVLMIGRLSEVEEYKTRRLRQFLREKCDYILAYVYDDWLEESEDFHGLVEKMGFRLLSKGNNLNASLVEFSC